MKMILAVIGGIVVAIALQIFLRALTGKKDSGNDHTKKTKK